MAESQKKKQQDDSDEYDDDDSAASTSFQPQPVQPQQGYIPPMVQPGLPPVPGAPGMPPGSTWGFWKFNIEEFIDRELNYYFLDLGVWLKW